MDWLILKLSTGDYWKNNVQKKLRQSHVYWTDLPVYILMSYQKKSGRRAKLLCQSYLDQLIKELEGTAPKDGYLYEWLTISIESLSHPFMIVNSVRE